MNKSATAKKSCGSFYLQQLLRFPVIVLPLGIYQRLAVTV